MVQLLEREVGRIALNPFLFLPTHSGSSSSRLAGSGNVLCPTLRSTHLFVSLSARKPDVLQYWLQDWYKSLRSFASVFLILREAEPKGEGGRRQR